MTIWKYYGESCVEQDSKQHNVMCASSWLSTSELQLWWEWFFEQQYEQDAGARLDWPDTHCADRAMDSVYTPST
jgi:hypothetical protein